EEDRSALAEPCQNRVGILEEAGIRRVERLHHPLQLWPNHRAEPGVLAESGGGRQYDRLRTLRKVSRRREQLLSKKRLLPLGLAALAAALCTAVGFVSSGTAAPP